MLDALSVIASFTVLIVIYVAGSFIPFLFWRLAHFREIRATQERLRDVSLDVHFQEPVWRFAGSSQDAGRASVYLHSSSSEAWIDVQVETLSDLLQITCLLQAVGVLAAVSDGKPLGKFHLLLHAPLAELGVLAVMAYLLHKMGKHWKKAKREFRVDAWN